jgi:hypothetical protein
MVRGASGGTTLGLLVRVAARPVPVIDTQMAQIEAAVETALADEAVLPAIARCTPRKRGAADRAHAADSRFALRFAARECERLIRNIGVPSEWHPNREVNHAP